MSADTTINSIKAKLADLSMPGSLEVVDHLMNQLDQGALSAAEAMDELLSAQVSLRRERRSLGAIASSKVTTWTAEYPASSRSSTTFAWANSALSAMSTIGRGEK